MSFDATGITAGRVSGRTVRMLSQVLWDNSSQGRILVSIDNVSVWREANLPNTANPRGLAFGRDMFLAITHDNVYRADNFTDNTTIWTADRVIPLGTDNVTVVTFCANTFFVGTDGGRVFMSGF